MQIPVLVGLAVMWAIVLLPDVLRRLQIRRSADSIGMFSRQLSLLERSNSVSALAPRRDLTPPSQRQAPSGQWTGGAAQASIAPRSNVVDFAQRQHRSAHATGHSASSRGVATTGNTVPATAAQRRQDIIVGLGALALLSLLAMFTFGGALLYVHLAVDVLLIAYLGLVLAAGRSERVRPPVSYIPAQPITLASYAPQRRTASR